MPNALTPKINLKRALFVGLGGTGGKVLGLLHKKMTDEEKENAKYVYIDTDSDDISNASIAGIETIQISNADNVLQVATSLGIETDGVKEWLPMSKDDAQFLSSALHNGASQCRMKSRLCLARYLKQGAPELKTILSSMTPPGIATEADPLRVVIVSSIAGGTGAGTFIQLALYIRRFFRELNQAAEIIGILSLPDIYKAVVQNEQERTSLFANAYAAIRELNAMNLATNVSPQHASKNPHYENDLQHLQGYGSHISIKIDTQSEGGLFNSQKPEFALDTSSKPFNLIYFVDQANEKGGILRSEWDYYTNMADVAYTRLFSPLNLAITRGESNELRSHIAIPTAIYGGSGFGKIVYPYEDMLHYVSGKHLLGELNERWTYFDSLWHNECAQERSLAYAQGETWMLDPTRRGVKFREDLEADLASEKPSFEFLRDAVHLNGFSRVEDYMYSLEEAVYSIPEGTPLPNSEADIRAMAKRFSILSNSKVSSGLAGLISAAADANSDDGSDDLMFETLLELSSSVTRNLPEMKTVFCDAIRSAAYGLAISIFPTTEATLKLRENAVNLHSNLLSIQHGGKTIDVHPLAARYLLYGLQEKCLDASPDYSAKIRALFDETVRSIHLVFDDDTQDDFDYTVEEAVARSSKQWWMRHSKKVLLSEDMLNDFKTKVRVCLADLVREAEKLVISVAMSLIAPHIASMLTEYENFFESIPAYRGSLENKLKSEAHLHEDSDNQIIYVCASAEMKEHFANLSDIKSRLESDPLKNHACAGAALYSMISEKVVKRAGMESHIDRVYSKDPDEISFNDVEDIFEGIVGAYQKLLNAEDTPLKTNVVGAIRNEILALLQTTDEKRAKDATIQHNFNKLFQRIIADLRAKSRPMIRYDELNLHKYFLGEVRDQTLGVSKNYCYLGLGSHSADLLKDLYRVAAETEDPFSEFHKKMALNDHAVQSSETYNEFEIFCFSSVHCLQPTQIYHFTESTSAESYYPCYKSRVSSYVGADCPHLDIRWNRIGSMPYISPKLELEWRTQVVKALIYEATHGKLFFCITKNKSQKVFLRIEGNSYVQPTRPENEYIRTRNISRLVEYLADDEERINKHAQKLDEQVARRITALSNYTTGNVGLYKAGMTKDRFLTLLREAFINNYKYTGPSAEAVDEELAIDADLTMGGLLHVAYLLHASEECLGEDKDYGELLLDAVLNIIRQYVQSLHGASHVNANDTQKAEMSDVFKWTKKKFLEAWVATFKKPSNKSDKQDVLGENVTPEKKKQSPYESLSDINDSELDESDTNVEIPDELRAKPEYLWLENNWCNKAFQN